MIIESLILVLRKNSHIFYYIIRYGRLDWRVHLECNTIQIVPSHDYIQHEFNFTSADDLRYVHESTFTRLLLLNQYGNTSILYDLGRPIEKIMKLRSSLKRIFLHVIEFSS